MDALKLGDPAPDLELRTPFDVTVALRPLLEQGPVALEFIRGTWDPAARQRIEALEAMKDDLEELFGARHLVVTCERAITAREYLERSPRSVPLLLDVSRETSRAYGVFRRFSFGAFHTALPSTFVVDRCGYVRYVHLGRSPIDLAPLDHVRRILATLRDEAAR